MAMFNRRLQTLEAASHGRSKKGIDEMTEDELMAVIIAGLRKLEGKSNLTEKENREVALLEKIRRGGGLSDDDLMLIAAHPGKIPEVSNHG